MKTNIFIKSYSKLIIFNFVVLCPLNQIEEFVKYLKRTADGDSDEEANKLAQGFIERLRSEKSDEDKYEKYFYLCNFIFLSMIQRF